MLLIRNVWLDMKAILRTAAKSVLSGNLLYLLLTGSNKLQQEQLAEQRC